MSHGNYLDAAYTFTKDDQVRKPVEHCSTGFQFVGLIALGVLRNQSNRAVKFI